MWGRHNFGASDPLVESCIADLKNQLVALGLLKSAETGPVANAIFIGVVAATAGIDAANKLANTSGTVDTVARLQACNLVKQIIGAKAGTVISGIGELRNALGYLARATRDSALWEGTTNAIDDVMVAAVNRAFMRWIRAAEAQKFRTGTLTVLDVQQNLPLFTKLITAEGASRHFGANPPAMVPEGSLPASSSTPQLVGLGISVLVTALGLATALMPPSRQATT